MGFARELVLKALRALPWRERRRQRLLRSTVRAPVPPRAGEQPARVLVLGVYLADRPHSAEHLVERLASTPDLDVEHRWTALGGRPPAGRLAAVTARVTTEPKPKFTLVNQLLRPDDLAAHDFIVVCDDDIHVPANFLSAFIAYQRAFGFAVAGPARTWHSHFDHAFSLRRPWLAARQTRFVECGPLVSFRRDAAALLLPFDDAGALWGFDLVWPEVIGRHGLTMGIVDAVPVDHSLRPQAATYDKERQNAAMARYLAATPHLSMREAFTVLKRYPIHRPPRP